MQYCDQVARVLARSRDLHTLSFYHCDCWIIKTLCGGAANILNLCRVEVDAKLTYDRKNDFKHIADALGSVMLGSNKFVKLVLDSCPSSIVIPALSRHGEPTGRSLRCLDFSVRENRPDLNGLTKLLRNSQGLAELSIAGYEKDDKGWSRKCNAVPASLRSFHVSFTYGTNWVQQQYISGRLFAKDLESILRKTQLEKLDIVSCHLRNVTCKHDMLTRPKDCTCQIQFFSEPLKAVFVVCKKFDSIQA